MLDISTANISPLAVTYVGNKSRYEGVAIPKTTLTPVHDYAHEVIIAGFLRPFVASEEFFHFHHESGDLHKNPVYHELVDLFADSSRLQFVARQLTERLYECMNAAALQGGEFFIAVIKDLILDGEMADAIGLFKIQSKDNYLKVERSTEAFTVNVLEGIPTGKLEAAALIFNLDEAEGFRVCAIDTVSKKGELSFWKDDFLRLRPVEDNYFNTRHHIALATEFIDRKCGRLLGLNLAQRAERLARVGEYFRENEYFDADDFGSEIFPENSEEYAAFRDEYSTAYAVPLDVNFQISGQAVKKAAPRMKRVLKLDRNFQLYVKTGRTDLIEHGYDDDKGKKFYKIYFDDEQ